MARKPTPAVKTVKPWEHAKSGEGSAADPLATRFVESLSYDHRLYQQDIAGSVAHARMLKKVGLITAADLSAIEKGLREIKTEIDRDGRRWAGWKIELEDVHMCIEAALIEKIGEPGRKLHTGRSRNDQVVLDLKLWLESAADRMEARIQRVQVAFLNLAKRDGAIVMPSYTHLQRAQPIVAGGELLAWMDAFERCARRHAIFRTILPRNPLGSGAIAGSALPLDREYLASLLPLGDPTASSIDATANRDSAIDFVHCLTMTALTLSRWAEQWIIYATTEFGFITLDGKYTTGSSMMPQKRNPDMLELIRGKSAGVFGRLVSLLTLCKALPIGYNRDLQEDKRHIFSAHDTVADCLEMAERIVASTRFNEDRIAATLDHGFLDATSLAEYLVTKGVAFRTAHQIVGSLVRTCEGRGLHQLSKLALADFNRAALAAGIKKQPATSDVYEWLGAHNVVKRYQTFGNAGLQGYRQQMKAWDQRLQKSTTK